MSVTVYELIDTALRKLGVIMSGAQASPEEYADGLKALKTMLDAWSLEALMVPYSVTEQFALDPTKYFYAMGEGGDWNTVRPEAIEHVRLLDEAGRARPLLQTTRDVLAQRATVEIAPARLYLVQRDSRFLMVEFDALPVEPWVLVTSRKPFNATALESFAVPFDPDADPQPLHPSGFTLTGIQTPLEFPSGYQSAIEYNLAVHLSSEYPGFDMSPAVLALAANMKALIKRGNYQPSTMISDVGRMTRRGGFYDIHTGP